MAPMLHASHIHSALIQMGTSATALSNYYINMPPCGWRWRDRIHFHKRGWWEGQGRGSGIQGQIFFPAGNQVQSKENLGTDQEAMTEST